MFMMMTMMTIRDTAAALCFTDKARVQRLGCKQARTHGHAALQPNSHTQLWSTV